MDSLSQPDPPRQDAQLNQSQPPEPDRTDPDPPAPAATLALPEAMTGQPPVVSAAPTLEHGPVLQWVDWLARLALWAVAVVAFAQQLGGQLADNEVLLPLLLFAALMALYLLASIAPVARRVHQLAETDPLLMSFLPLLLLFPYVLYGRLTDTLEVSDLLVAGILLFMPTALVLVNSTRLRAADVSLGLIAVAMPLVLPLTRNEVIATPDVILRLGAFLLPVLLLLLTSREQKQRLNFLFVCAVLSLWYSVEFDAFPSFALPGLSTDISYFHLAAISALLYILAAAGKFGGLGLSFRPTARGVSIVASNLALFTLVAVPLGLLTKFIAPSLTVSSVPEMLAHALTIYLFVALPEEILFRGALFRYLDDTLRLPQALTIGLASLLFGAAHLNNPPNVGWYIALATVAGVFYARTYIATKNVAAAATLHAAIDWLWGLIFAA